MTRLIVDSPPTREIDSQRRLLRGKCNYADDYAPRPVTIARFPFCLFRVTNWHIAAVMSRYVVCLQSSLQQRM